MDQAFARDCDRAIFVYATALELGFRFATDGGGTSLWFDWPPDLSPAVLGPMRGAIEKSVPFLIALVEEGLACEGCEESARPPPAN